MRLALLPPVAAGLPAGLLADGNALTDGWDIETSDREAFLTLSQSHGRKPTLTAATALSARYEAEMPEGRWQLELATQVEEDGVRRSQTLSASTPLLMQDFVCRYRFPKALFPAARIAGHTLTHSGANVWHQYPVSRLELLGPAWVVHLSASSTVIGDARFRLDHYVRDEPGPDWVVHARMMPSPEDQRWLRWETRWGRILDVRSGPALRVLSALGLDRPLWYLAERRGGRPNIALIGLARLGAGAELSLVSELRVIPAREAADAGGAGAR